MDTIWLIELAVYLACLTVGCAALLRGWHGWLDLKRLELADHGRQDVGTSAGRIVLADLKERVRKLEAIADGIDPPLR